MNSADCPAGHAGTAAGAGKVIPVATSTSAGGIAAPGDTITSTFNGSSYASMSGTSMASPYVAGGAALVWSTYPTLSRTQLRDILRASATTNATTLASPNAFGAGLINLDAALTAAAVASGGATPVAGSPTATRTVAPTATKPAAPSATATPSTSPSVTATEPVSPTRTAVPTATPRRPGWWWDGWRR